MFPVSSPLLTVLLTAEKNPQACLEALDSAGAPDKTVVHIEGQDQEAITVRNQAAAEASSPFLLLLSSTVLLGPNSLPPLLRRLASEPDLAGVNPLLLSRDGRHALHLGYAADSRGQLHSLYEGIAPDHPLATKRRAFQAGHEAALLLRREDFLAAGGFLPNLEGIAATDFCLRLTAARGGGFSTEPAAQGSLCDPFDSWKHCGLWNSLLQRGKIDPATLRPDYHKHLQNDDLPLTVTPWLHPCPLPSEEGDTPDAAWLRWRRTGNPAALLALLRALPQPEQNLAARLCRELPSSLPRAFSWYRAQAAVMNAFAERENLPALAAQLRSWRARANMFRERLLKPAMAAFAKSGIYNCALDNSPAVYDAWLELKEDRGPALETGRDWPKIAVIMPVYNGNPAFLRAALDSVLAQHYGNWQLCIADDASTRPEIPAMLRAYAARDARVRVIFRKENGHISLASNSAIALTDAPFAAMMDHDDELSPNALLEMARAVADSPLLRFLNSDSDIIDERNVRRTPLFKAVFDPDLHFTGHLSVYSTQTLRATGGFRAGFEGSQDFDLSLRVTETLKPSEIAHIPRILYHWRVHAQSTAGSVGAKPYVLEATRKALTEHARRRRMTAEIVPAGRNNFFTFLLDVPRNLRLSIILLASSARQDEPGWAGKLKRQLRLEILRQPPASDGSYASACNAAARKATGEVVLFLDAALAPLAGCRPEQLAAAALRPDLSMVGGCLQQSGMIHHVGLYPDVTGLPFPLQRGFAPHLIISLCWGQLLHARRALAASWRCMAVRREDFLRNKGFDPAMGPLAVADYCLRREQEGLTCLMSPWAWWELPPDAEEQAITPALEKNFLKRWGKAVANHGLRNPNLRGAPDNGWTLQLENV
ncbi:MAG: glycosyltransferase [Desulfovibrio sp.]|jgi:glycosyltransferase involved in cell wall biosynthesis|nr:glycosyltransferase [Desulfovibrio sp.]